MKKVVLYGELGRKFGKYWHLDVKTPAEAVRAIGANKPEFTKYLLGAEEHGMRFKVFTGREDRSVPSKLVQPVSDREVIRIVPVIVGAGAVGQFILGVVLVVVGVFTENPMLIQMGVGLMVSGAATLIVQHLNKPTSQEDAENPQNKPSFAFGGAVNTMTQGGCVPVCYGGPIEVGSYVVSGGVDSRDIPI